MLQDNGADDLSVTSNGSFSFTTTVASGDSYAVTVATQPGTPKQTCVVTSGTGSVVAADVTDVVVTCTTDTLEIGGTVTGLASSESVVLQDNGGDDLTLPADGTFQFATAVASGQTYTVTVKTDPETPLAQTCTVTGGAGTVGAADVTTVAVTCATRQLHVVIAAVTGITGTIVLQDNGGDDLTMSADGTHPFATTVASGATYAVTLKSAVGTSCQITNGSGTMAGSDVTVQVSCSQYCFEFSNDANANLTDNHWLDACVDAPGNTITVILRDTGGNVVYQASGQKVGTWSPYDFLTSTDATSYGTPQYATTTSSTRRTTTG